MPGFMPPGGPGMARPMGPPGGPGSFGPPRPPGHPGGAAAPFPGGPMPGGPMPGGPMPGGPMPGGPMPGGPMPGGPMPGGPMPGGPMPARPPFPGAFPPGPGGPPPPPGHGPPGGPMGPPGAPHAPRPQGMQSRIDPSQIPRPVVAHHGPEPIAHATRANGAHANPPPSTARFIVRDCGGASPRLLRSTLNAVPHSPELLGSSGMPFSLVVQPMALPDPADDPVQVRAG
jgi:protein transport protein SEC24